MAYRPPNSPDAPAAPPDEATLAHYAEQDHRNIGRRVRLGLVTQILSLGSSVLAKLLLVPFFLMAWGSDEFGEWLILQGVAGLLLFTSFGQQVFYGNRMRSAWAVRDYGEVRRQFARGWTFFTCLLVFLLSAVTAASFGIDLNAIMNLNSFAPTESLVVILLLTVATMSHATRELVLSVHLAKGEFYVAEVIHTSFVLAQTTTLAIMLVAGAPPTLVALTMATFGMGVTFGIVAVDYRRRFHWLLSRPDFRFLQQLRLTHLYAYGVPQIAMNLANFLPAVLLGLFSFPGRDVVVFNLTRNFTSLLRVWAAQVSRLSAVELSRQEFQRDVQRRRQIFWKWSLKFAIAVGLVAGTMFGLVEPIFRLWTAGSIEPAILLMALLMARAVSAAIGQFWLTALRLSDHMDAAARTGLGYIVTSVLGSLVGIELGGLIGLAWGVLVADALFTMLLPAFLYTRQVQEHVFRPIALVLAVTTAGFAVSWWLATLCVPWLDIVVDLVIA